MSQMITTYLKPDTQTITILSGETYTSGSKALYTGKDFSVAVIALAGTSPSYTLRYEVAYAIPPLGTSTLSAWIPPKNTVILNLESTVMAKGFPPVLADYCRFLIDNNSAFDLTITVVYTMVQG